MLSPALPNRHRQTSGRLRCQEVDSSPNGLASTLGSPVTGLRSRHIRCPKDVWDMLASRYAGSDGAREHHLMDQLAASEPVIRSVFDAKLVSAHQERLRLHQFLMGILDDFESVRSQLLNRSPLSIVNQAVNDLVREETCLKSHHFCQPHTTVLATQASVNPTVTAPSRGHDKRRSNQKNSHLICAFCKNRNHTIDRCNMRARILQRFAALTASGSVPSSNAASFDPVSLTTPTYSIADLQALFSQVQPSSSSASNPTFSVTPSISSEWFLDSVCCNHMMDNPHLISVYTPPVLPTITIADGSAITDSRTGQIVRTARKVGRLFELTSLHFPFSSVSASVIAASASIELWHSRLNTVRALTNAASTLVSFWGEAALTTVYTINRCPSPVVHNTTPYERLFGTAPNYSLLKVFGCVCFVLLQPNERTKLQLRSLLCCFLGYGLEEKGYRCYDPIAKRLQVSRHVIFWEHKMFYSLPSFSAGNSDSHVDPLPGLFPEIPSTFVESVNPISDESLLADPTSDEPLTTDPTFDKSHLSALAANSVNTTAPEPRRSHRLSTLSSHLRDFHCFSVFATLHEPHTFREASSDPLWQQVMKEELDALLKTVHKIKTRSDGTVDCYKTHLVAKEFTQEYGIDYEETFAPVARLSSGIQDLKCFLGQHFEMKDLSPLSYFLGLKVSSSSDGYYLTQAKYTSDLISRAGITDSKIVDTPIEYNNRLNTHNGEPLPDTTLYKQLVRSLIYLTITRPDIPYAVHIVNQFMAAPRKKQSVITRSSTEAEYRAFADTTAKLLWLRWLPKDLGVVPSKLPTMTSSMSVPSILRSIVTLFVITYYRVLCNSVQCLLRTS
uniref:Uncharacterized protein n=1 Tax=Fagus sylvatica TaxID=28930 RepID=A0A2N9HLL6_FAGSY